MTDGIARFSTGSTRQSLADLFFTSVSVDKVPLDAKIFRELAAEGKNSILLRCRSR